MLLVESSIDDVFLQYLQPWVDAELNGNRENFFNRQGADIKFIDEYEATDSKNQ